MTGDELRKMSGEELQSELHNLLKEQFNLRMQKPTQGAAAKTHEGKRVRRAIARLKTIMTQKEGEL